MGLDTNLIYNWIYYRIMLNLDKSITEIKRLILTVNEDVIENRKKISKLYAFLVDLAQRVNKVNDLLLSILKEKKF